MNASRIAIARRAPGLAVLAFVVPGFAQGIRFDADPNFDVDPHARSVIEVDLDGDGDLDLAVPCDTPGSLCVLENIGPADFAPRVSYPAPLGAWRGRAGDLDGDGDLDLAVVSWSPAGRVTVFLNAGNGTFPPGVELTTGSYPSEVEFGDVDGDLDPDLVVASAGTNSVSVLLNQGGGAFASYATYAVGASPSSIVLVDLDLDGDLDVAATNEMSNTITILWNTGAGVFTSSTTLATGSSPVAILSADFANDGWPDLVCANLQGDSLVFFQGIGGGSIAPGVTLSTGGVSYPNAVFAEDYGSDGDLDLTVSNGTLVGVLQNQAGTFLPAILVPTSATIGFGGHDYDADGDRDLVVPVEGALQMRLASPDGSFPTNPGFNGGSSLQEILARDLDGDGDVDIATLFGSSGLSVLRNQGTGAFGSPASIVTVWNPYCLAEGDVDGDADLDLVVGGGSSPTHLALHRNLGSGAFGPLEAIPTAGGTVYGVAMGDIDGDGDADILQGNYGPPNLLEVHLNTGGGNFAPPVAYTTGPAPFDISLGDIDGDGDLDVVFASSNYNRISVMRNSGSGVLGPRFDLFVAGFGSARLRLGDLDLDGDLDAVATNSSSDGKAAVSFQTSPGVFAAPLVLDCGATVADLYLEDLDGDGDRDIVTGNAGGSSFTWHENLGGGVFAQRRDAGGVMEEMGVGDVDGDGDVDLLGVHATGGIIAITRNVATSGRPYCAGDGSSASCPCGNQSAPGSEAGCLNSLGTPGRLRGSGRARLADDRFQLLASGMPNSSALFFQGTTQVASVFGDGLRCAGGSIVRLATKSNSVGASVYPGPADPRVSVRGGVTTSGTRTYQVWYRNAASFCTSATFNLTNGWLLEWGA